MKLLRKNPILLFEGRDAPFGTFLLFIPVTEMKLDQSHSVWFWWLILVIIMELRVSSEQFSSRCLSAWHHFENQFATYLNGYPVKAVSRYLSLQTANSVASWGCCNLRVMLLEGDAPCRWWPSLETWSEDPPEAGFQLVPLILLRRSGLKENSITTKWLTLGISDGICCKL